MTEIERALQGDMNGTAEQIAFALQYELEHNPNHLRDEYITMYTDELFKRGWSKSQFLQWVTANTPKENKQEKVDIKTAAAKLREAYPCPDYSWFIIGVADTGDEKSHLEIYTEEAKYQWAMQNMPTIWMDYVVVVRKGGCPLIMLSEG